MKVAEFETRDLRDYLAVVRRRRLLIGGVFVFALVASLAASLLQAPQYRASAEVQVRTTGPNGEVLVVTDRNFDAEIVLAQSTEVNRALAEAIGRNADVSVSGNKSTGVITFTAEADDPDNVAVIANTYAQIFIKERAERRQDEFRASAAIITERITETDLDITALDAAYRSNLAQLETGTADNLAQLQNTYNAQRSQLETTRRRYEDTLRQLSLSADFFTVNSAALIVSASPPASPFSPDLIRNLVTAALVALVFGIGLAFVIDYFDEAVTSSADFESMIAPLPTLAVIPRLTSWKKRGDTHLVSLEAPRSAAAEAYRSLRTAISFLGIDNSIKILQVTSSREQDGKSTTASNLAVVSALWGQRVLLVDGDLLRPRQHEFFGLEQNAGLAGLLRREAELDELVQPAPGLPELDVLTAGSTRSFSQQLLESERFKEAFGDSGDRYGLIIIDSPPVLSVADPLVITRSVDAVLLVAAADNARRREISATLGALAGVGAPLIGAVLNAVDTRAVGYSGQRYEYGYAYAAARSDEEHADADQAVEDQTVEDQVNKDQAHEDQTDDDRRVDVSRDDDPGDDDPGVDDPVDDERRNGDGYGLRPDRDNDDVGAVAVPAVAMVASTNGVRAPAWKPPSESLVPAASTNGVTAPAWKPPSEAPAPAASTNGVTAPTSIPPSEPLAPAANRRWSPRSLLRKR